MPDLTIRMTVPIQSDSVVSAPALTFSHWLPLGDTNAISVTRNGLSLRLWFDMASTTWASENKEEDLPKMVNVLAHRLYADVTVSDVDPALLPQMHAHGSSSTPAACEKALQDCCDVIAERALVLTLQTVNRLISYVRSTKGQYWLCEYEIDTRQLPSLLSRFKAQARYGDGDWFRFGPSNTVVIVAQFASEERYIREEDWDDIRQFISSTRRTPLAQTLLAGAEGLAALGHTRSALTEAVTALEVVLYEFASHPRANEVFGHQLAPRMGLNSLRQQVGQMGLSGSIRYLLPVLFSESGACQA